jgi:ABC-type arginine transport system permease subunit
LAVEIHDTALIKLLGVEKELSQKRRFRQQKMGQEFCLYLQTTALYVSLKGEERRRITTAIAHE